MSILEIINIIILGLIICFSFYRYKKGELLPLWIGFVMLIMVVVDAIVIIYNV
jgi:hypothetical protein